MMYQVKFTDNGTTIYGILEQFSKEAKAQAKHGMAIVQDAILPKSYLIPLNQLTEIPMEIGRFDSKLHKFVYQDEYHTYVTNEFEKAQKLSDSLEGLQVGSLFGIGVGDGTAWYVVTKVNKKTCKIEWRGFCLDRWTDHHFGYGGTFNIKEIERWVGRADVIKKLFGA